MEIVVNGKKQNIDSSSSLQVFIEQTCPNPGRVVAEVNEKIIKRDAWSKLSLKNGDKIELVTFVGGG